MKAIHIRDVEPWVLSRIRSRARMHHRSVQGELRAILEDAARRTPEDNDIDPDELITVSRPDTGTWRREEVYGDTAR